MYKVISGKKTKINKLNYWSAFYRNNFVWTDPFQLTAAIKWIILGG